MNCPKCNAIVSLSYQGIDCPNCRNLFPDQFILEHARLRKASPEPVAIGTDDRMNSIDLLRIFAVIDCVASIIGSIIIFATMGTTGEYSHETNPAGIFLGFAVLFQGIFGCAFFFVLASIAEDVKAIRNGKK